MLRKVQRRMHRVARALARASTTLTDDQIARLSNIDFLVDSADEEIDTLLDELGIADPDEEGEPEETPGPSANSVRLRAAIRSADNAGEYVRVARLRAQY